MTKVKYAPHEVTLELIEEKRQAQEYFETRSMKGCPRNFVGSFGEMPPELRKVYEQHRPTIDFTIISYSTSIGWHMVNRGWFVPEHHYSATTFSQQRGLRMLTPQVTA